MDKIGILRCGVIQMLSIKVPLRRPTRYSCVTLSVDYSLHFNRNKKETNPCNKFGLVAEG